MKTDPNEKIRQQFDLMPYPNLPATETGRDGYLGEILHSFVSAWYAKTQRVCDRQDLKILDVGCGSGVTTLALAMANPNAKIVGIDLSDASLRLASDRLTYHGFLNAEFYNLPIAELDRLKAEKGEQFDYINCEDTLYFLADPVMGLEAMRSVLAPEGILRANVHSFYQRTEFFRAQSFSRLLGFLDRNPTEIEYNKLYEIMEALGDGVLLKSGTWSPSDKSFGFVLMNYVMQEDKGYTMPEVFQMLRSANLEFIGTIAPADWRWQNLFPREIPEHFANFLTAASPEQNLHAYELLHPVNRLIDFWCGHSGRFPECLEIGQWTKEMWQSATVYLHPVLGTEAFFQAMDLAIAQLQPDPAIQKLHGSNLDPLITLLCLRFLWQRPCNFSELVTYWCDRKPKLEACRNISTVFGGVVKPLSKLSDRQARDELQFLLSELVLYHLVLVEQQ
jgi:2-polyprenyl-3-methyl-5-hydroxy-6-metoxy-1,4-benzoquinol methylase